MDKTKTPRRSGQLVGKVFEYLISTTTLNMMKLVLVFVLVGLTLRSVSSAFQCSSFDQSTLFTAANTVITNAEKELMKSGLFDRVYSGWAVTVVNSTTGEAMGGGTNPLGIYQTYFFDGTQVIGSDFCAAVPACSAAGGSGAFSCHVRCNPAKNNTVSSFALGPADAIVFTGCTAPSVSYFGWDMYIEARITEQYPFYPGQNFGDAFNNQDIEGGSMFNTPISVVQSADKAVIDAITKVYSAAGTPVYAHPIDGSNARLWDRSVGWEVSKPDVLSTIIRASVPQSGFSPTSDFTKYQKLAWPVRFYMAPDGKKAQDPYVAVLKSRAVDAQGTPLPSQPAALGAALQALESGIVQTQNAEGYKFIDKFTLNGTATGFYDDWNQILSQSSNATFILPTRDGLYGVPQASLGMYYENTTYTLIGALQPSAAYHEVMISIFDIVQKKVAALITLLDSDLQGSADRYLQSTPYANSAAANALFAIDIRLYGQCRGAAFCVELPKDNSPKVHGISTTLLELGERVYALKETSIGADASLTILSTMISFQKAV